METVNDLSDLENDGIKHFADYIFNTNSGDVVLQFDAEVIDMFCGLTELVLYGIDILCDGAITIFNLRAARDPLIDILQEYLKRMRLRLWIREGGSDNCLEIARSCDPIDNPLVYDTWQILEYRLMVKKDYVVHEYLHQYSASFTANNKLFSFGFKII